jgi:uncharacterized membrane-anchored protein
MTDGFQRLLFKAMMALFVMALALSLLAEVLRSLSTLDLVVIGMVVSCVAYYVRERRRSREKRPRSTSSGERTPVMPRRDA